MQERNDYYVKSFEEDFVLKTLKGKRKVAFQTIDNIIKNGVIRPNTKSFGREMRLSTTIIHKNYLKTYRPQGLIFQTKVKPKYILPFDLVLLSKADKIIVHYYRIKNNLHLFYNHDLIQGFQKFVFKDFKSLIKTFKSPKDAWKRVNSFRVEKGYAKLPKQKYRLVEYDEVVFNKPIKIKPIAIYGYRKEAIKVAKKYNLPWFVSSKKFYETVLKKK